MTPQRYGKKRRRRRHSKRYYQKLRIRRALMGGLVCVIVVFAAVILHMNQVVSKYPEKVICDNIYVGSVKVAGLTKADAKQLLEEKLDTAQDANLTIKVGEKEETIALKELELSYKSIDQTLEKAVSYGKKGTLWNRYRKIKKLQKEKLVLNDQIAVNEENLTAVLKEKAIPLAEHAVDATISKTSTGFYVTKEKEGKTIDLKSSVQKVQSYLDKEWDYSSFVIELEQKKETPSVKATDLESIQDELGAYATDAGGGERWQNLKTGVGKINGTILMPGEEVSVHDLTAPYDAEHGYVAAGSYENGQVVETYGGGICQVSSTLYNALLYAELEIVKRYPHSMLVAYVDPSRDAAIAGDYKDLVFKNNQESPIYIEGMIDASNQLKFTVYGKETRAENRKVEYESETVSTEDYGVTYKEDTEAALGSQRYGGSPHTGREAKLWKVVYEDGKEVSRDVINQSSYQKSDQIIYVGTKSENASASAIVRAAIATQDFGKIQTAISEASSQ